MPVLRIEHPVGNFEAWKQAFDADPMGRERLGVIRYTILRSLDDPHYVMVDLELDSREHAETMRVALREMWQRAQADGLIGDQEARIADVIETREVLSLS